MPKSKNSLTIEELKRTHTLHQDNKMEWRLYETAFEGIKAIVKAGYIEKHEREPQSSYDRRKKELYGFGYSAAVIRILNFYLFKKPPERELNELKDDEQWQMFFKDVDLYGNGWDNLMMSTIMLQASILGHIGIMMDKSPVEYKTVEEEKKNEVYPYMAIYYPSAILDWTFERDKNNRPFLAYLKLLESDGTFKLWFPDSWQIWQIDEVDGKTDEPKKLAEGINPLGFIPFIWHYNMRSKEQGIGISDLSEIARIDISIIKNASQLEEVINFAAFPMMRKAQRDVKPGEVSSSGQEDEASVQAIMEFDPEHPDSKPDWMPTEVGESITGILQNIEKKVGEIYRAANIGGLQATEVQTSAKSGVALTAEFQMLNAELVSKAVNLENTENTLVMYWMKWQKLWEKMKEDVHFGRARTYDIEDLTTDLENAITSKALVMSNKFDELIQKKLAKQSLPTMSEDDQKEVDKQIEDSVSQIPDGPPTLKGINDPKSLDIINRGMESEEERKKEEEERTKTLAAEKKKREVQKKEKK